MKDGPSRFTPVFRFDAGAHAYFLNDQQIPSITQLIEKGGLLNGAQYYTPASRERGTEVHRLAMEYEMGTLDPARLETPYRGYVLAYIAAVEALKPSWSQIEVADVHPTYRFGGRPDRVGTVTGKLTTAEIKTAAKARHHSVQTALQAILIAWRHRVTTESIQRLVIYVKPTGKFLIEKHTSASDFHAAMDLIRRFC